MTALIAMLMPDKPMGMEDFFGRVLPAGGGYCMLAYQLAGGNGMYHESFGDVHAMATRATFLSAKGATVYFAVGTFRNRHDAKRPNGQDWGRKGDNVEAMGSFFLDIDVGEGKGYPTTWDARQALEKFSDALGMPPNVIVESSGGEEGSDSTGLHVYWTLDRDLTTAEWNPIAWRLKEACRVLGLKADPARTADVASLLRPVGTRNRKAAYGPSGRPVRGQWVRFGQVSPEAFDARLQSAVNAAWGNGLAGEPPKNSDKALVTLGVVADSWFQRLDEPTKQATVRSMLGSLPDADVEARESWIAVGAALAGTAGIDPDVRFSMWSEWSQRTLVGAAKWKADTIAEHKERWNGLTRSGVGALVRRAQDVGWTQEDLRSASLKTYEAVATVREEEGARMSVSEAQAHLRASAIHIASSGTFLLNGVEMSKDSMDMTLAPRMPLGDRGPIAASSMFKGGHGRTVDYVGYRPGFENFYKNALGIRFVNTWKKHVIESTIPSEGDKRTFAELILHLSNGDAETRAGIKRLFTKLAFLYRNPRRRIRHATLLIGPNEGCGKTTLTLEIPRALFGADNVRTVETRELSSDFNSYAQGAQILVFPELWLGNRRDALGQANGLKPLITDDHIPMVKKGRDGVMVDNCTTIFANSNHADAAVFGEKDRRYDVVETSARMLPPMLSERVYALIRERPGALCSLVLAYGKEAECFDPNTPPPMTAAKNRMVEAGRDVWVERIRDAYTARLGPFTSDAVAVPDVRRWLERDFDRLPGDNKIREELLNLADGALNMRAQRRHGDSRQQARVIVLRNVSDWVDAGPSAMYDHYSTHANNWRQ